MTAIPQSPWHWTAVVYDMADDSHPVGSFDIQVGEARRRDAALHLAKGRAVAEWPGRVLDVHLMWTA